MAFDFKSNIDDRIVIQPEEANLHNSYIENRGFIKFGDFLVVNEKESCDTKLNDWGYWHEGHTLNICFNDKSEEITGNFLISVAQTTLAQPSMPKDISRIIIWNKTQNILEYLNIREYLCELKPVLHEDEWIIHSIVPLSARGDNWDESKYTSKQKNEFSEQLSSIEHHKKMGFLNRGALINQNLANCLGLKFGGDVVYRNSREMIVNISDLGITDENYSRWNLSEAISNYLYKVFGQEYYKGSDEKKTDVEYTVYVCRPYCYKKYTFVNYGIPDDFTEFLGVFKFRFINNSLNWVEVYFKNRLKFNEVYALRNSMIEKIKEE